MPQCERMTKVPESRKAPPFNATKCGGQNKKGVDNCMYMSVKTTRKDRNNNVVFKWKKIKDDKKEKNDTKVTNSDLSKKIRDEQKKLERRISCVVKHENIVKKANNILNIEKKKMIMSDKLIKQFQYMKEAKGDLLTIATGFQGDPFRTNPENHRREFLFNMKRGEMIVIDDDNEFMTWRCKISKPVFGFTNAKHLYKLSKDTVCNTPKEYVNLIQNIQTFKGVDMSGINIEELPNVKDFIKYRNAYKYSIALIRSDTKEEDSNRFRKEAVPSQLRKTGDFQNVQTDNVFTVGDKVDYKSRSNNNWYRGVVKSVKYDKQILFGEFVRVVKDLVGDVAKASGYKTVKGFHSLLYTFFE